MTSANETAGPLDEGRGGEPDAGPEALRGTSSLVSGAIAVALYGSPLLPAALPPWLRFFPLYLTVPAGVFAVVSGAFALRDARHTRAVPDAPHEPGTDRRRARTGIALGAVALAVPLVLLVWAGWALP